MCSEGVARGQRVGAARVVALTAIPPPAAGAPQAQRGPATRPLIGRGGDAGGMGASQIGRRFREDMVRTI